ncbi:Asp23/Gls24 family envelope stress response protein [Fodinicola acaciae]|uniref:Asp23/Gls24 family envelope stress response protein n=1 Tax=Fodinicola acaciae TaxID=2681555 RepID=UPI0013D6B204|nr:Asp23/Gls24 family envelope stress response protein [Fodinicola acaciae]
MADNGIVTISERAVERIAAHALTELSRHGAKVGAHVTAGSAILDVRLAIGYPQPVTAATEAARDHLTRRVEQYTGLTVSRVDIAVTALRAAESVRRRVR